ncbi:hypothetical protein [Thermoanaerobacterium thermosaccharolyticum]|uniref:hypothetical protein n=1 Tax=Thermoanaerobacterium thermosaccharolyticum TaxID=1517 RepID=UPI003DA9A7B0
MLFNKKCGAKLQKKSAYVLITAKTIQIASYLKKMSTEEYSVLRKIRNGVEGIPSILRRKYHVDVIPVRGLMRSKIWFSFRSHKCKKSTKNGSRNGCDFV